MAAPQTPDWLNQFLQQHNMVLDKTGNIVPAPANNGMVKPFGNDAWMGGSPGFNEAAGGTQIASQPGIDTSRLYNGTWNPNAPPIFNASDITYRPAYTGAGNVSGVGGQPSAANNWGSGPQAAGWVTPGSMSGRGSNWDINFGQNNPSSDAFNLAIKDAAGTAQNYGYTKDPTGKYWIPAQNGTGIAMDTNNWADTGGIQGTAFLAGGVYGATALGAGGAAAPAADAAPGAVAGTTDVATALPVSLPTGAAPTALAPTTETGLFGTGITGTQAASGVGAATQLAPNGGGGSATPTYTTGSDQNFGATPGGNSAVVNGTPNGNLISQIQNAYQTGNWGDLASQIASNPNVWGSAGQALLGYLGQGALTGNANNQAQQNSDAFFQFANRLSDNANQIKSDTAFKPVGYTNASGSTQFDPATGTWKSTLSPEMQNQFDMFGNLGKDALARYQNLDPQALAAKRYADTQSLVAPGRAANFESTLGTLKARGLLGQGVTDVNGATNNPLMSSLATSNAQADRQMAIDAENYGQSAQQQGLATTAGLFGLQQPLVSNANATFNPALSGTQQQLNNNQMTSGLWANLMGLSANGMLRGAQPNSTLYNSQQQQTGNQYGMWADLLRSMMGPSNNGGGR